MKLNIFENNLFDNISVGVSAFALGLSILTIPVDGFAMDGEDITADSNASHPHYATGVFLPDSREASPHPICDTVVSSTTELITPTGDVVRGVLMISSEVPDENSSIGGMRPFGWRENHPDYLRVIPTNRPAPVEKPETELSPYAAHFRDLLLGKPTIATDFDEHSTFSADAPSTMHDEEGSMASHYTSWPADDSSTALRDSK